ncbi:MAG TPA: hypothetical protein PLV58_10515 [Campylobacterales bacterium]|nr:hypothetical protein [Campylobacterales bacterium]
MIAYKEIVRNENDAQRVSQILRDLGGDAEVIILPLENHSVKPKTKNKTRITDKLAGCLSEYAKGKENISIKEARDIAWGAVVKEKHDSGRY